MTNLRKILLYCVCHVWSIVLHSRRQCIWRVKLFYISLTCMILSFNIPHSVLDQRMWLLNNRWKNKSLTFFPKKIYYRKWLHALAFKKEYMWGRGVCAPKEPWACLRKPRALYHPWNATLMVLHLILSTYTRWLALRSICHCPRSSTWRIFSKINMRIVR
jgi:hypothetical protein